MSSVQGQSCRVMRLSRQLVRTIRRASRDPQRRVYVSGVKRLGELSSTKRRWHLRGDEASMGVTFGLNHSADV